MALTKITHSVLEDRYTAASAETSAATVTCDKSTADTFTWTLGHDVDVKFTNVKVGDTATLVLTGAATSYEVAFPAADGINGASSTFNKIGGTLDATSGTKNFIEFKFISTSEAWYQISQIAS